MGCRWEWSSDSDGSRYLQEGYLRLTMLTALFSSQSWSLSLLASREGRKRAFDQLRELMYYFKRSKSQLVASSDWGCAVSGGEDRPGLPAGDATVKDGRVKREKIKEIEGSSKSGRL